MKKALFSISALLVIFIIFSGCIKNTPYVTTLTPYMTASVGSYNFSANTTVPAIIDTQYRDTAKILQITGNTTDLLYLDDQIILYINDWKGQTGIYSIVQSQANGIYHHGSTYDPALGGIIAVTKVTSNSIIGYFSFNTAGGSTITNGEFSVGRPFNY